MTNGNYELPIMGTVKTAWAKSYGSKASVWAGIIISYLIFLVMAAIGTNVPVIGVIFLIAGLLAYFLMTLGLINIGLEHAAGRPVSFKLMFVTLQVNMALKLIGVYFLQVIIMIVPGILFAVAGFMQGQSALFSLISAIIYVTAFAMSLFLMMRMYLSWGFVLEKKLGPVQAIKKSVQATQGNVLELIAIFCLELLILFVCSIPLGIGLIWGLPFAYVLYGTIYQRLANKL